MSNSMRKNLSCIVPFCFTGMDQHDPTELYPLPSSPQLRRRWLNALKLSSAYDQASQKAAVCSKHLNIPAFARCIADAEEILKCNKSAELLVTRKYGQALSVPKSVQSKPLIEKLITKHRSEFDQTTKVRKSYQPAIQQKPQVSSNIAFVDCALPEPIFLKAIEPTRTSQLPIPATVVNLLPTENAATKKSPYMQVQLRTPSGVRLPVTNVDINAKTNVKSLATSQQSSAIATRRRENKLLDLERRSQFKALVALAGKRKQVPFDEKLRNLQANSGITIRKFTATPSNALKSNVDEKTLPKNPVQIGVKRPQHSLTNSNISLPPTRSPRLPINISANGPTHGSKTLHQQKFARASTTKPNVKLPISKQTFQIVEQAKRLRLTAETAPENNNTGTEKRPVKPKLVQTTKSQNFPKDPVIIITDEEDNVSLVELKPSNFMYRLPTNSNKELQSKPQSSQKSNRNICNLPTAANKSCPTSQPLNSAVIIVIDDDDGDDTGPLGTDKTAQQSSAMVGLVEESNYVDEEWLDDDILNQGPVEAQTNVPDILSKCQSASVETKSNEKKNELSVEQFGSTGDIADKLNDEISDQRPVAARTNVDDTLKNQPCAETESNHNKIVVSQEQFGLAGKIVDKLDQLLFPSTGTSNRRKKKGYYRCDVCMMQFDRFYMIKRHVFLSALDPSVCVKAATPAGCTVSVTEPPPFDTAPTHKVLAPENVKMVMTVAEQMDKTRTASQVSGNTISENIQAHVAQEQQFPVLLQDNVEMAVAKSTKFIRSKKSSVTVNKKKVTNIARKSTTPKLTPATITTKAPKAKPDETKNADEIDTDDTTISVTSDSHLVDWDIPGAQIEMLNEDGHTMVVIPRSDVVTRRSTSVDFQFEQWIDSLTPVLPTAAFKLKNKQKSSYELRHRKTKAALRSEQKKKKPNAVERSTKGQKSMSFDNRTKKCGSLRPKKATRKNTKASSSLMVELPNPSIRHAPVKPKTRRRKRQH